MSGKKTTVELLIELWHPFGEILEIGFSPMAAAIQEVHPRNHTIIESEAGKAKEARKWAQKHPTVKIIEESWESALPNLGIFNSVFWAEKLMAEEHAIPALLKEGSLLLQEIEAQFPSLSKMRYTDSELDDFCRSASISSKDYLSRFLNELERKGQIQPQQLEKMVKKYHLKGKHFVVPFGIDPIFFFLKACFKSHMEVGSRFACFSKGSKFEDPLIFEQIITNPSYDYQEHVVNKDTLIILIEKLC
ncbi:MAG TPA: hypothetical protein VLE89_01615 [Chlamydiales bacterium]|nr:hypothetical protein [Chlamydiales bacterium]